MIVNKLCGIGEPNEINVFKDVFDFAEQAPSDVLIQIFSSLSLPDLESCSTAFIRSPKLLNCVEAVLFGRVTIITTEEKDENSEWADECLNCVNCNIRGVNFKSSKAIYTTIKLDELHLLAGFERYVTQLQVSCMDISSLHVFGRNHNESDCLECFVLSCDDDEESNQASETVSSWGSMDLTPPRTPVKSEVEEANSLPKASVPRFQMSNMNAKFTSFINLLNSMKNLKTVEILCPCLHSIVKNTTRRNHKISHMKSDSFKSTLSLFIEPE